MLEIAVCDDDVSTIGLIETLLQEFESKHHIELRIDAFTDGIELEKYLKMGSRYDIIYMDVEMKNKNGLDTARELRKHDRVAILIYVTSHESYMPASFDYRPFQFIVKPIKSELFEKYFLKAYEELSLCDFYFQYMYNKIQCKVLVQNIMYFESNKRAIFIISIGSKKKFYDKLKNVENMIKKTKARFLRIHQSYLVNYKYIAEQSYDKVTLTDGTTLPISEDKRKEISKQYSDIVWSQRI